MCVEKLDHSSFTAVVVVTICSQGCLCRLIFHTYSYLLTCNEYAYIYVHVFNLEMFHFSDISVYHLTHSFFPLLFLCDVKSSILLQILFSMS